MKRLTALVLTLFLLTGCVFSSGISGATVSDDAPGTSLAQSSQQQRQVPPSTSAGQATERPVGAGPKKISSASSSASSPSSVPAACSETSSAVKTDTVWVTLTGKRYHASKACGNMKHAYSVSLSEAKADGYTPCQNCY